jgi:asparagine synthase (glutamine-hydrolysing)
MLDKRFFLGDHNLIYTDKMAMATSVEVRVPFLDLELVKFASEIPTAWKLRGSQTKWILKESQRGMVPDICIDRPKTGFGVPLRSWMQGGLRELTNDLSSRDTITKRGIFDPAMVEKLRQESEQGNVDGAYTLFSLMCIELWCQRFLDGAGRANCLSA